MARWLGEGWAGFPVERTPRPLVVWHRADGDGGFRSGEAKEAFLHADKRTLTMSFTGAPPAFADYPRAEGVESHRAVAIVPVEKDLLPPGTIRVAVGHERVVEGRLARPLGARVLVDLDSSACQVTPA